MGALLIAVIAMLIVGTNGMVAVLLPIAPKITRWAYAAAPPA
jgi:hypothetical protein